MEESLKHRILGISIFVIFLSFIVPLILDGNDKDGYLERTLVKSDQIENSSRRIVEINLIDSENLKFLIDGGFADIALDQVTLLAERSFDLVESSKEDFDKIINDVAKDIEESEDDEEKEDLLIKKEILEANYS